MSFLGHDQAELGKTLTISSWDELTLEVAPHVPVTGSGLTLHVPSITHPVTAFPCLPHAAFPHPVTSVGRNQNSLELWSGLGKGEYQSARVERQWLERLQGRRETGAGGEGVHG